LDSTAICQLAKEWALSNFKPAPEQLVRNGLAIFVGAIAEWQKTRHVSLKNAGAAEATIAGVAVSARAVSRLSGPLGSPARVSNNE
jgi:hypothetical protein